MKLRAQNRSRPDGMSLSRTLKIMTADRADLLLIADSGPGDTTEKGLITPKFGSKPENHIAVSLSLDGFGELMLATQVHYQAWLTAWYMGGCKLMRSKEYVSGPQPEIQATMSQVPSDSQYVSSTYLGVDLISEENDLPF